MADTNPVEKEIHHLVHAHRVVLFMKGTRTIPQCGFSAAVVSILDELLSAYHTVDVIAQPAMREGVKAYTDWPTIPRCSRQCSMRATVTDGGFASSLPWIFPETS